MGGSIKLDLAGALLLAATLLMLGFGQVLFKLASKGLVLTDPRSLLAPTFIGALVIYGVATLLWMLLLKRFPLSIVFPFYGLTFLLVPLLAHYILGEKIGYQTFLGGGIILLGVYVTSLSKVA